MLEIKVQDKSITTVQKAVFIRGTVGEKVAISCDEEWGNRLKTVVFKRLDPCAKPIVNYIGAVSKKEVVIPHEILHESGQFYIGVYSVMGIETTPTLWSEVFNIEYGTDTDGVAPQPPTPSEYSQLIQLAEETKEIANSVREDADIGVFNGEDGFSPTVDVEQIDGGHRVTITDENGDKTFDVMDGKDGQGGSGVSSWNDLTDKPFYAEMTGSDTLQFGDYPPLGEFKAVEEAEPFFKWSNNTPSDADFAAGAELHLEAGGHSRTYSVVAMSMTDWVATLPPDIAGNISVVGDISVILDDDGNLQLGFIVRTDGASIMGIPIEVGTYTSFDYGYLKINGYTGFETIVTFDGDYSKYEYIELGDAVLVHVSDKVLTVDDLTGATIRVVECSSGNFEDDVIEGGRSWVNSMEEVATALGVDIYGAQVFIVTSFENGSQGVMSVGGDLNAIQAMGLPFAKEGTYFVFDESDDFYVQAVSCLTGLVETVKPLDEKYIPSSVVLESELESKGYQTEAQVTELINNALGVIENAKY